MEMIAYDKLLSELGIPSEWSEENIKSVLEEKYSEELELLDVAQAKGEEYKIGQLEDRIKKIEEALENTKELAKRLSSGLVLNTQSDKDRLDALKKDEVQAAKQFEASDQFGQNASVSQSASFQNNANSLLQSQMRRAEMELEDQNWKQASRLYDEVLDSDPENAEANLGMFMVNRKIRGKKYIPEAARNAMKNNQDIFKDSYFLRTLRYADDKMQKEIESYEKGRDYLIAVEDFQRAKTDEEFQNVSEKFEKLGDFADSKKQKEKCDGHWKKRLYDLTMQAMKSARKQDEFIAIENNFDKLGDYEDSIEQKKLATYLWATCILQSAKKAYEFSAAENMFEGLGDYSNSKEKKKECEDGIKRIQKQQESYGKYKQEYKKFEEQFENLQEIKVHGSNIDGLHKKKQELILKNETEHFGLRWIIGIGLTGLIFFLSLYIGKWASDNLSNARETASVIWLIISFIAFFIILYKSGNLIISFIIESIVAWILLYVADGLIIGIVYVYKNFSDKIHMFGTIALSIAILLIGKKLIRKTLVQIRNKEIIQLDNQAYLEFDKIGKVIISEYKKIYDKYPDAGSDRKKIKEVQMQLLEQLKKRYSGAY